MKDEYSDYRLVARFVNLYRSGSLYDFMPMAFFVQRVDDRFVPVPRYCPAKSLTYAFTALKYINLSTYQARHS